jgi:calcium-dependent protein kinase
MSFFKRFFKKRKVRVPNIVSEDNVYASPRNREVSSFCISRDVSITEEFGVRDEFYNIGISLGYKIHTLHSKRQDSYCFILTDDDNKKYFMKVDEIDKLVSITDEVFDTLIQNPNEHIIKIIHCMQADRYRFVIMDNIQGWTLGKYLELNNDITEHEAITIFRDISYGIKFLHSLDIIHCDIKMENIMVDDNGIIKIIDFDISIITDKDIIMDRIMGTSLYICPEICDLMIYSKKADIWSFGVVMYKYITNIYPYDEEMMVTYTQINMERYNKYRDIDFDILDNDKVSKSITEMIKKMLSFNYDDRPDINGVINILNEELKLCY